MAAEQVLAFRNGPSAAKQSPPTKTVMPPRRPPPVARSDLVPGVGRLAQAMPLQRGVINNADLSLLRFGRAFLRPHRIAAARCGFDILDLHEPRIRLRIARVAIGLKPQLPLA